MKIKIVSDGTRGGTKVLNAETGELIEKVVSVRWNVEAGELPIAVIKVLVEAELVVELPELRGVWVESDDGEDDRDDSL